MQRFWAGHVREAGEGIEPLTCSLRAFKPRAIGLCCNSTVYLPKCGSSTGRFEAPIQSRDGLVTVSDEGYGLGAPTRTWEP